MARFTVRVELHDVRDLEDDAYNRLHREMEAAGFLRIIEGGDGKRYHMPRAEYNYTSNETGTDVRAKAKSIADRIDNNSGVLVTEGTRYWVSLKEVE